MLFHTANDLLTVIKKKKRFRLCRTLLLHYTKGMVKIFRLKQWRNKRLRFNKHGIKLTQCILTMLRNISWRGWSPSFLHEIFPNWLKMKNIRNIYETFVTYSDTFHIYSKIFYYKVESVPCFSLIIFWNLSDSIVQ